MKKLFYSLLLFVLIVTFSFSTLATNTAKSVGTTTLDLVEDTVCTIKVDDIAKFEKKITKFDKTNRSATLTLSLTNTKVSEFAAKPAEVFLVIDNSNSMTTSVATGLSRREAVLNSANLLVDKLFTANAQLKVGVVSFSSLDSSKGETEGTINDSTLVSNLTDSKETVKSAISSIPANGLRTNIDAGLTRASDNFTTTKGINRYIVLLSDGVPNNDTKGNFSSYTETVIDNTVSTIESIRKKGITMIGAMIGLNGSSSIPTTSYTYATYAEAIFGTEGNSTLNSYYNIPSTKDEIEATIVEKIYKDIVIAIDNTLKNFQVKDYFPQEIIDNFKFEHVTDPNIGKVTAKVDTKDNSITWTIPELKEGQTAKLSYKLTLKENYNKEIIDKVLPTNAKVDITGEDSDGKKYEKSSKDSPKVKVLYKDNTVAKKVIPQTGENSTIIFAIIGISSLVVIATFVYLKRNKNI